jgi:hypothetical protein
MRDELRHRGTRVWILLMDAGDGVEPLFLQAKEAQVSVLAEYATYADQNELDYAALQAAVKNGKAEATTEI